MIQTQRAYELNSKAIQTSTRCCRSSRNYEPAMNG
jgi:flagellar basal body rod protein FlgG